MDDLCQGVVYAGDWLPLQQLFRPLVDRTFTFREAAAAHRYVQERKNFGKVILLPQKVS